MTKQFVEINKLTVSEIIDKNNRLIEALKNLNDKLSFNGKSEQVNQKDLSGKSCAVSDPDPV